MMKASPQMTSDNASVRTESSFNTWYFLACLIFISSGAAVLAHIIAETISEILSFDERVNFMVFLVLMLILQYAGFRGFAYRLEHIELVLRHLNHNKQVLEMPPQSKDMLGPLVDQVNMLIRERATLKAMRGKLYEQISETAAQEERKRLARDLHDSIKQQVFSMSISASAAYAHLAHNPDAAREALNDVKQSAQEAMVEMRALLQQLAPAPLEKSGLMEALREQAEALSYRTGAKVETHFGTLPDNQLFPPGAQETVFRITQESLSNIARHARAKHVSLSLQQQDDSLCLSISDDGQGFDKDTIRPGMGLNNIRARAEAIQADISLESQPGIGTSVTLRLPLVEMLADPAVVDDSSIRDQADRYLYWHRIYAWAFCGLIISVSLVVGRLLRTPEAPFETTTQATLQGFVDGINSLYPGAAAPDMGLLVLMGILIVVGLSALGAMIWSYPQAYALRNRLIMQQGPDHAEVLRIERHNKLNHSATAIFALWFTPLIWVPQTYSVVWHLLFCGFVFIWLLWNYYQSFVICTAELLLLPAQKRLEEIARFQTMVRASWSSIALLGFILLITGSFRNGIQLIPQDTDAWMTSIMVLLSLLLIANQFIYILYYRQQSRDTQAELRTLAN